MHWLAYTVVMDSFLNIRFISFSSRKLNYWNSSLTRTFPLGKMCVCFSIFPPLQLLLRKNFRKQIGKKNGKGHVKKGKTTLFSCTRFFLPFFRYLLPTRKKKTWVPVTVQSLSLGLSRLYQKIKKNEPKLYFQESWNKWSNTWTQQILSNPEKIVDKRTEIREHNQMRQSVVRRRQINYFSYTGLQQTEQQILFNSLKKTGDNTIALLNPFLLKILALVLWSKLARKSSFKTSFVPSFRAFISF